MLLGCTGPCFSVTGLRCENMCDPLAIDTTNPHFSWKIESGNDGLIQSAYEIMVSTDSLELAADSADLWSSGKVYSSSSVMVPYGGCRLSAPSLSFWKVRVWNESGKPSDWSRISRFGVGVPDSSWEKEYVGLNGIASPLFRRSFHVDGSGTMHLLHMISLGYHEVYVNGSKVSDEVLSPSVSQMDRRVLSVTYDITRFLNEGDNEIAIWLGRGWYRKSIYESACDFPLFMARIDRVVSGKFYTVMSGTDGWQGCDSGYYDTENTTWRPLQFGGELMDGNIVPEDMRSETLAQMHWSDITTVMDIDTEVSPRMNMPNIISEILEPAGVTELSDSVRIFDMGKTITGWIEANMTGLLKGAYVRFEYSDCDDGNGGFKAQDGLEGNEDIYIAAGRENETFRNKFNHHAFRYIRVSGHLKDLSLKGLRIQENFGRSAVFECSDSALNSIYRMVARTLPNLAFGGYVVDCPHLERMGYGGDGNASAKTFQTLFDASPLYMNWMRMWADCIKEDGGMPHNVPNPYGAGGGPYWCGFIITASWEAYLNYGDDRMIRRYYPQMLSWLGYVDRYTENGLLGRWPDTSYRGWYLGDWLAPEGVDYMDAESVALVSNCYLYICLDRMEKIASVLGNPGDSSAFMLRKKELAKRINERFYNRETAVYASGSQIDQIYPLLCGIPENPAAVEAELKKYTSEYLDGHIGVGLVGVTVLADWAVESRNADFIVSMLREKGYPGYLYMIENGATSTWESWSGERSRIHNCYNGIGSWFIQGLAGISPEESSPGYAKVRICPQVADGVNWVKASKETPYGTVEIHWSVTDDGFFTSRVTLPPNCTGEFIFPECASDCMMDRRPLAFSGNGCNMMPGHHVLKARIALNQKSKSYGTN